MLNVLSYSDAVQMIFSMHCCLHLCGQPVSVGRLDQLLIAYYKRDLENGTLTREKVIMILCKFMLVHSYRVGCMEVWIFLTSEARKSYQIRVKSVVHFFY